MISDDDIFYLLHHVVKKLKKDSTEYRIICDASTRKFPILELSFRNGTEFTI